MCDILPDMLWSEGRANNIYFVVSFCEHKRIEMQSICTYGQGKL